MTENKMHICSAKSAKRTIVIGGKKKNKSLFGRIDVHLLGKTGRLVLDLNDVEGRRRSSCFSDCICSVRLREWIVGMTKKSKVLKYMINN